MLSALLASLWSRIGGYLAAVGIAAGVLLAAYQKGRSDAAGNLAKENIKTIREAREVENEISGLGAGELDARLDRWMRDDKR